MKLDGEYIFEGPREQVWEMLQDPNILVTALPGAKSMEKVAENKYEGELNLRIGPVAGEFAGQLMISDEKPPESCTLTVEGKGKPGFVNGIGHVFLEELPENRTLMKYEGDLQVGGRLASVGQRLMDTASKSMIRQGLDKLNQDLKARQSSQTLVDKGDVAIPSETAYAATVAKDVARDIMSTNTFKWIMGVILAILALYIIWLVLNSTGM